MTAPTEFRAWRKSSFSAEINCVEVALGAVVVGVRDSKNASDSALVFDSGSWSRLLDRLTD